MGLVLHDLIEWLYSANAPLADLVVVVAHVLQHLGVEVVDLHATGPGHLDDVVIDAVPDGIGMSTDDLIAELGFNQAAEIEHVPVIQELLVLGQETIGVLQDLNVIL